MNQIDDLIVNARTIGEILAAIEGYRQQLDAFSQQALAEIALLKSWIEKLPDKEDAPIVLHPLIESQPEQTQ
jgi:hypothetical protein